MDDCRTLPLLRKLNIPCYIQIYDIVYEMISNGILKEGDTILMITKITIRMT